MTTNNQETTMHILNQYDLTEEPDPINDYDPKYQMTIAEDVRCNWCAYVLEVVGTVCLLAALALVINWNLRP